MIKIYYWFISTKVIFAMRKQFTLLEWLVVLGIPIYLIMELL
jgi:hypothetical protein